MAVNPSQRGWRPYLLASPALVLLLVFFLAPMLLLVRASLDKGGGTSGFGIGGTGFYRPGTWTLHTYTALLRNHDFHRRLGFTLLLAVVVTSCTVTIAYPLAVFIHRLSGRRKALALAAVVLPKLSNVLVVVYGLVLILSNDGPINRALIALGVVSEPVTLYHSFAGVVIGETYLILPYAVLVLVAALDRIDPTFVSAARGLGASRWRAFTRITLPLSAAGIALATLVTFIWAMGAFVGPVLLGSPEEWTLGVEVQHQASENLNMPRGAATAVIMLLSLCVCVALYQVPARLLRKAGAS
jgi:ABC-type spermidine/putrescine transport system permease subunit I